MRFKQVKYMNNSNLHSMLITRHKRGVATWPRPPTAPATRHEVSVRTFGIVSPESMLVKVQFLLLREYYDSGLLWRSHPLVATTNAGKRHKTDLRYSEIEALSVWSKFCETTAS